MHRRAGRRCRRCVRRRGARGKDHHRAGRRQCRAPAAAAHRQRESRRRSGADRASTPWRQRFARRPSARSAEPRDEHGLDATASAPDTFSILSEIPAAELRRILRSPRAIKSRRRKGAARGERPLAGKVLAMIFDKPSTRTRVSFDVGMRELGGETIMLTGKEMQLGRGETIADTARVLSRFVDAIVIRMLDHDDACRACAHTPTCRSINGLTKRSHPCQVMADVMTFEEHRGPIKGRTVAWTRRRQQRARKLDPCGAAVRFLDQCRNAGGTRLPREL